jgi:hypothetical protein|tara:strand:- start:9906 stop:10415 length:510 start_codon:yes stop_codon:yes gene_type:complete
MLLIASGAVLLPASLRGANGASISLDALNIDADQEAFLAEFVETLIPATDTPGAQELKVHLFVLKMIDDCHGAKDQKLLVSGFASVDDLAKKQFGNRFVACKPSQRKKLLESLNRKKEVSTELAAFNTLVKNRAIQGYLVSQYVMTDLLPHKMIPDPYDGYYPASNFKS